MKSKAVQVTRLIWHGKHEFMHLCIGIIWFTLIRDIMGDIPGWYVWIAIFASILPDMEHIHYLLIGKTRHNEYSATMRKLFRERKFIQLFRLAEKTHKKQIFLRFHHLGIVVLFFLATLWAFERQHQFLSLLYGSIFFHYLFDIMDDLLYLRRLNPNWTKGLHKILFRHTQA